MLYDTYFEQINDYVKDDSVMIILRYCPSHSYYKISERGEGLNFRYFTKWCSLTFFFGELGHIR